MSLVDSLISVPASVLTQLDLTRWNALTDDQRLELGRLLTIALNSVGYPFDRLRVQRYGPAREQAVLQWHDARTDLEFILIPGGVLTPGYDDAQLALYARIYERLEGWKKENEEEKIPDDFNDPPERTQIFAGECPCDLRRKPNITIPPFFMATTPVSAGTPELRNVIELPSWWGRSWEEMTANHEPLQVRWPQVEAVLRHYRWTLATSTEYEWALNGGVRGLFYWGDSLPAFVLLPPYILEEAAERLGVQALSELPTSLWEELGVSREEFERMVARSEVAFEDVMLWHLDPERPPVWPYCNRFGLIRMLAGGTWCAPAVDEQDPFPLIVRGGAAGCYPWQACGEWKSLLTAAERRLGHQSDYGNWNEIRPIIRIRAA